MNVGERDGASPAFLGVHAEVGGRGGLFATEGRQVGFRFSSESGCSGFFGLRSRRHGRSRSLWGRRLPVLTVAVPAGRAWALRSAVEGWRRSAVALPPAERLLLLLIGRHREVGEDWW